MTSTRSYLNDSSVCPNGRFAEQRIVEHAGSAHCGDDGGAIVRAAGSRNRCQIGEVLRRVRVVRDYGMFDRREAPQFYPDADGRATLHA